MGNHQTGVLGASLTSGGAESFYQNCGLVHCDKRSRTG